jgi:hypothetical protein
MDWNELLLHEEYYSPIRVHSSLVQASNILVESPSAQGCLYFLACFLNVQCIWIQKMGFDARFVVADDLFHRLLELLGLAILASIVVHIRPVSSLENNNSMNTFALSLSVTLSWLFYMGRILELYWMGQGQKHVIQASSLKYLKTALVGFSFCLAATIVSGLNYFGEEDDYESTTTTTRGLAAAESNVTAYDTSYASSNKTSDLPIWLLLGAPVLDYCISFVTVVFLFPNDGSHKQFST